MIYIIVFVGVLIILFVSSFKGGGSPKEIRELYVGNYFAEDGVTSADDKPNSRRAFAKCIENGLGLKVSTIMSADKKVFISTKNNLLEEFGVDNNASAMTAGQLEELGIVPLAEFLDMCGRKVPVIIEIKNSENYDVITHALAREISNRNLNNVAVASLSPAILAWFKHTEKHIIRAIISAPSHEFKSLPKMEAFLTGNMAYNGVGRPHIMLYRNRPESSLVKFALGTSGMVGVWTLSSASEAKKYEEEKDLIICRGFMPENPHFKDIEEREKSQAEIKSEARKEQRAKRQDAKDKIREEEKNEKEFKRTGVAVDKKAMFFYDDEEFEGEARVETPEE